MDLPLRTAEAWTGAPHTDPIHYLEYPRTEPASQSREGQAAIDSPLKFYRIQYEEAKKKGLFRPQD